MDGALCAREESQQLSRKMLTARYLKKGHTGNMCRNQLHISYPPPKKIEMTKLILLTSQEGLHDLHDQGNGDTETSCLKPDPLEEVRTFLKECDS